jgi:hypothetical protein
VLACFAGVHGLEHIGTEILLAYIETLIESLSWDRSVRRTLREMRLIVVPMVNPAGVLWRRRANARGVDLMRNAPVEAEDPGSPFELFRGHRLTSRLPWYRGALGAPMEVEARAVCDLVRRELFAARFSMVLDVHSGYLGSDRLWFPYAKSRRLIDAIDVVVALKRLLDATYSNHRYVVEPQSANYTTHGDLWDHLYDMHRNAETSGIFLPLTLELGASSWWRKNPAQLTRAGGLFHPMEPHRVRRVLRRHVPLIEFLVRATHSFQSWVPREDVRRRELVDWAQSSWQA